MAEAANQTPVSPEVYDMLRKWHRARRRQFIGRGMELGGYALGAPYVPKEDDSEKRRMSRLAAMELMSKLDKIETDLAGDQMLYGREWLRYKVDLYLGLSNFITEEKKMIYAQMDAEDQLNFRKGGALVEQANDMLERGWHAKFENWSRDPGRIDSAKLMEYTNQFGKKVGEMGTVDGTGSRQTIISIPDRHAFFTKLISDLSEMQPEEAALFIAQLEHHDVTRPGALHLNVREELGLFEEDEGRKGSDVPGYRSIMTTIPHWDQVVAIIGRADKVQRELEEIDEIWLPRLEQGTDMLQAGGKEFTHQAVQELIDQKDALFDEIQETTSVIGKAQIMAAERQVEYVDGRMRSPERLISTQEITTQTQVEEEGPVAGVTPTTPPLGEGTPVSPSAGVPPATAPPLAGAPTGAPVTAAPGGVAPIGGGTVPRPMSAGQLAKGNLTKTRDEIADFIEELGDPVHDDDPAYVQMRHAILSDKGIQERIAENKWENVPDGQRFRWLAQDIRQASDESVQAAYRGIAADPNRPAHERTKAKFRSYLSGDYDAVFPNRPRGGGPGSSGSLLTKVGSGLNKLKDRIAKARGLKGEPTEEEAAASRAEEIDPGDFKSLGPEEDIPAGEVTEEEAKEIMRKRNLPDLQAQVNLDKEGIITDDPDGTLFVVNGAGYWLDKEGGTTVRVSGDKAGQTYTDATGQPMSKEAIENQVLNEYRENRTGPLYADVADWEDLDKPDITEGHVPVKERGRDLEGARRQTQADVDAIKQLQELVATDPRFQVGEPRMGQPSTGEFIISPEELEGLTYRDAKELIKKRAAATGAMEVTDEELDAAIAYKPAGTEIRDLGGPETKTPGITYDEARRNALYGQLGVSAEEDETEAEFAETERKKTAEALRAGEAIEMVAPFTPAKKRAQAQALQTAAEKRAQAYSDEMQAESKRKREEKEFKRRQQNPWNIE